MYDILSQLTRKPSLFEGFDTSALWADPHISQQMLRLHLDNESALASRPFSQIDSIVDWISNEIAIDGKVLLDLGCGPGLYAARFQHRGAAVIGIDISESSVAYARAREIPSARFILGSYHEEPLPQCDIAVLIYGDICAMPQSARLSLFKRVRSVLRKGGHFILDCFAPPFLSTCEESLTIEQGLDDGFWAADPYIGLKQSFLYEADAAVLDRYLIVEQRESRWVHNWIQCLTPEQLSAELDKTGFAAGAPKDVTSGGSWHQSDQMFYCIAQPC